MQGPSEGGNQDYDSGPDGRRRKRRRQKEAAAGAETTAAEAKDFTSVRFLACTESLFSRSAFVFFDEHDPPVSFAYAFAQVGPKCTFKNDLRLR